MRGAFAAAGMAAVGTPALAQSDVSRRFQGFNQILDVAQGEGAQFLLMYDSNHMNRDMPLYPLQRDALALAQSKGVKNIFLELAREHQPLIDGRASGKITHEDFMSQLGAEITLFSIVERADVKYSETIFADLGEFALVEDRAGKIKYLNALSAGIEDASRCGIRIVGADKTDFGGSVVLAARQQYDDQVADYIASVAGGQKSIVVYGMGHGSTDKPRAGRGGGLDDELRRRAGVVTVEMQDNPSFFGEGEVGKFRAIVRETVESSFGDRSPNVLNIDTGKLSRGNAGTAPRGNQILKISTHEMTAP